MTTYNLSAFAGAGAQFFDDNGVPLVGGKLYTYAAGTTTPLATYTTSAGTVANSNPIILDAAGRTPNEIWLATGVLFKFILKTSTDVLIGTYDGIPSVNDPFGIYSQLGSVAGTNAITAAATPTLTTYVSGATYSFIAANTNTGAATLSIDGLTAKSITKNGSVALTAGDIQANKMMLVEYDGTTFQLLNNIVYGGSLANATIVSLTAPLSPANGGSGIASPTANSVLLANGAAAYQTVAPGTVNNILTSNGTTWTSAAPAIIAPTAIGQVPFSTDGSTYTATQKIGQGTAVASTSGTSIDFTGIPSWVKRVTVMLSGVTKSATSNLLLQIGNGSIITTGYAASTGQAYSGAAAAATSTIGFPFFTQYAADALSGSILLTVISGNTWIANGCLYKPNFASATNGGGTLTLSSALDRIRITSTAGTETFSAGSINILYE